MKPGFSPSSCRDVVVDDVESPSSSAETRCSRFSSGGATAADTVVVSSLSSEGDGSGSRSNNKVSSGRAGGGAMGGGGAEELFRYYSPETFLRHRSRAASLSPLRVRKLLEYSYRYGDDENENDGDHDEETDNGKTRNGAATKQQHALRKKQTVRGKKVPICKMILVACLAASCIGSMVLVAQSRKYRNLPSRRLAARAMKKIERRAGTTRNQSAFTVVLRGSRIELLQQSLDHHARCRAVKSVRVEYLDGGQDGGPPPSLLNHGSRKVALPTEKIKTDGVLLLDEGVIFTCEELDRAFVEWRDDPARLVSLLPPISQICEPFVSDAAVFVHRLLVNFRPKLLPSSSRCQHLALSASLAAVSSKQPVSVLTEPFVVTESDNDLEVTANECVVELKRVYEFEKPVPLGIN